MIEEKIKDYKTIISNYSRVLFNTVRNLKGIEINSDFFEKIYNELESISIAYKDTELEEYSINLFMLTYAEINKISKELSPQG